MRVSAVEIYRYSIPFTAPMRVGQKVLDVREGFILALTTDDGYVGYGEIAPLSGLDETTLDQCLKELMTLRENLIGVTLHFDRFKTTAPLLGIASVPMEGLSTHIWFGLECAFLGLYLQQSVSSLQFPLRGPVNGLFIPNQEKESVVSQILELKKQDVKTIKVKIGRMAADEEIRQILDLIDKLGSDIVLRLDGNRSLTPELYVRYYEALRHLPIEYVEEPLLKGNPASIRGVPWPIALDESLEDLLNPEDPRPSSLAPAVQTIILKPGLLSGLHAIGRCIADANSAGIKTVLSSSFNTGITLSALGVFSRLMGLPSRTAHGFDTLRYLQTDVLTESPGICDGQLVIPEAFAHGEQHLNFALLHREDGL